MIKLKYRSAKKADLICHSGRFHADDVFATVFLCRYFDRPLTIARVSELPKSYEGIAYDIGFGKFDHHQLGGNGFHRDGIPYAAFGLLWKELGMGYCSRFTSQTELLFNSVEKFVEGIDAYDNGMFHSHNDLTVNISMCIGFFNPAWNDSSEKASNRAFLAAVTFADSIFENFFKKALADISARDLLKSEVKACTSDVLILDRFIPFSSLPEIKDRINYLVYPSNRGGYNIQILNNRLRFKRELCGLSRKDLNRLLDMKSVVFVHNSGRLATIEDCRLLAAFLKIAVEQKKGFK